MKDERVYKELWRVSRILDAVDRRVVEVEEKIRFLKKEVHGEMTKMEEVEEREMQQADEWRDIS